MLFGTSILIAYFTDVQRLLFIVIFFYFLCVVWSALHCSTAQQNLIKEKGKFDIVRNFGLGLGK